MKKDKYAFVQRAKLTRWLLWIVVGLEVPLRAVEYLNPHQTFNVIGMMQWVLILACVVSFLVWESELRIAAAGVKKLSVWASMPLAIWFFPWLNLFLPYMTFQALWKEMDPHGSAQKAPAGMLGWWICWVLFQLAFTVPYYMDVMKPVAKECFWVSSAFWMVSGMLCVSVVESLTQRVQQCMHMAKAHADRAPAIAPQANAEADSADVVILPASDRVKAE